MKTRLRVACLQLSAGVDWQKNLRIVFKQLDQAVKKGADIAALPENFLARTSEKMTEKISEIVSALWKELALYAKENKIWIVAGSVPERLNGNKYANTCAIFSDAGKMVLKYRKIHLFDSNVPKATVQESRTIRAGNKPGFFKLAGIRAGAGICYDLRFPEYFRKLSAKGAEILFLPSNFTAETGKTAWEVLVRARAIENQCYVVAPAQCGRHPDTGIVSYGNSLIVDPLGRVLKRGAFSRFEVLTADLSLGKLRDWRKRLPALKHRKIGPF